MKVVEELKRAGIKTLKNEEWKIEDRIVMKEDIHTRRGTQGGDNMFAPQHPSRRTRREMEDSRVDCQE